MRSIIEEDRPHAREALYWEHEGNSGVRKGPWKLVRDYPGPWELYNMQDDRPENHNQAAEKPEIVQELDALWQDWARRVKVQDWNELLEHRRGR